MVDEKSRALIALPPKLQFDWINMSVIVSSLLSSGTNSLSIFLEKNN